MTEEDANARLRLPSATTARFLVIISIFALVASIYGTWVYNEFFPGSAASKQIAAAIIMLLACSLLAFTIYVSHPLRKARTFGPADVLANASALSRIEKLESLAGIKFRRVLVDHDIRNADAIVFGLPGRPTLLVGKRIAFLAVKNPAEFDARIAHELAHVKNKDFIIAIVAESMLTTIKVLFFVILLARLYSLSSIIYNENSSSSVAMGFLFGIYVWSRWFILNLFNFCLVFVPHCLFWVLIAEVEYRSILRVREVYADGFSRALVGPDAISSTLSVAVDYESTEPQLHFMRYHPSRRTRRRMILRPSLVGLPEFRHFFWLGFLTGAGLSTFVVVTTGIVSEVPSSDVNVVLSRITEEQFRPALWLLIIMLATALPHMGASTSMTIRYNWDLLSRSNSVLVRLFRIGLVGLCVGAGFAIGDSINPQAFRTQLLDTNIAVMLRFDLYTVFAAVCLAAIWVAVSLVSWVPLYCIAHGNRTTRIRSIEWLLLSFLLIIFLSGFGSLMTTVLASVSASGPFALNLIAGSLFWTLLSLFGLGLLGFVSGGFARFPKSRRTTSNAPIASHSTQP